MQMSGGERGGDREATDTTGENPTHSHSQFVKYRRQRLSVSTADARGVRVALHSTQEVCNPSTAMSDTQGKHSVNLFCTTFFFVDCVEWLSSDWLG